MDLKDKRVLVFGAGISGIGAVSLLCEKGAQPILYDSRETLDTEEVRRRLGSGARRTPILCGDFSVPVEELDLAVLSPGVPTDLPAVRKMKDRGLKIWGEVELAYQCSAGSVLAVTGTNGKTTTTSLLGEIMKAHQDNTFVVGNIGTPYTQEALKMNKNSVTVAEISSFQLETIDQFHPKCSAILNLTPDHLDRHHTMEEYIRVKERIAENQTEEDVCVLNYEDPALRAFGEKIAPQVLYFSSAHKLKKGLWLENGKIFYGDGTHAVPVIDTADLRILGRHNWENAMAAAGMALAFGVPVKTVADALARFQAVEHRIEFVCEKKGVAYYNDSKGTNPDAAIKGIQAMNRPTLLIGGGYDKGSSYEEWIDSFDGKVKCLVLLGQTREKIAHAARRRGFSDILMADSLEEAVKLSADRAEPGDAVLLSPACASWDMFPNYEVRGRRFKELVGELEG